MNTYIKKSRAIAYIIGLAAILLMLGVWPSNVIHRSYKTASKVSEDEITASAPSSTDKVLSQVIITEGTRLKSMDVYICNDVRGKRIDFAIYDGDLQRQFYRVFTVPEDTVLPGYIHIPIGLDTQRGTPCIISICGGDRFLYEDENDYAVVPVKVGYEDHYSSSNTSVYPVNYDGEEIADKNMVCGFNYEIAFNGWQTAILYVIIAAIAAALIILTLILFAALPEKKAYSGIYGRFTDKDITTGSVVRPAVNCVTVVCSVVALYFIYPRCYFGDKTYNIVFSYISVILFDILVLYYVNYKRKPDSAFDPGEHIKTHIREFITAIAIAEVLWYCFEYMNGLYDIDHSYSARRILIWFFIMLITTFTKREFLQIANAVWLVAGIPVAYFYAKPYTGVPEKELLYKLSGGVIYAGGFILINVVITIIRLIRKKTKFKKLSLTYFIPFAVFVLGLVICANTRWWPLFLFVIMALLIFRLGVWKESSKWVRYLCDGVILNFLAMVIFSLHHRPYHTYIYHRYNMTYYTVTMTATHLTLCMAAIAVRLFIRYREEKDKRALIPELALFGTVACYTIFTLSRTAYAAVAVMILAGVVLAVMLYGDKKARILRGICYLCVLGIATAVMFPIVFSATRMIPAVCDDPVIYEYEPASGTIYKGTEPGNEKYMDIRRFKEVFDSKVLQRGDTITRIELPWEDELPMYASAADIYEEMPLKMSEDLIMLAEADEDEEGTDLSNGRMDIFRSYIEQSGLSGHETMGAILNDGSEAAHAHNIYLQVIFDHGLIYGIYFALFLAYSWIVSVIRLKKGTKCEYDLFIPVILAGFMAAGMAEWIFHPCNPFGLAVCLAMAAMVFAGGHRKISD